MSEARTYAEAKAERDARISAARDEALDKPIVDIARRLEIAGLRRDGSEWAAPCPVHGGTRDRLTIHERKNIFLCRGGGQHPGGDQIALVRHITGKGYVEALEWIVGGLSIEIDQDEQERRRKRREEADRRAAEDAEKYRRWAIRDAKKIWDAGRGQPKDMIAAYLATRGIDVCRLPGGIPRVLRFVPDHPYFRKVTPDGKTGPELVEMHRGPCMIAAVQAPNDRLTCAHQTWIDPEPPHAKARIEWQGAAQKAKLTRGSKNRGAIRLITPPRFDTLVMGEGIETTLTAAIAWPDLLGPDVAYWAGIDLGHMGGKMQRIPGQRQSGLPNMNDEKAFVPPPWIDLFILIQDGDSDPASTRAKLESCARRAMAHVPGLRAQIVPAGEGVDLNDVLVGARQ